MPSKKQAETAARMGLALQREQQASKPAAAKKAPRVETVRITLDLEASLYQDVKAWAFEADANLSDVGRAMLARMIEHPPTAAAVRQLLDQPGGRRRPGPRGTRPA